MTPEELNEKRQKELARQAQFKKRISCCTAAGCLSCGGQELKTALSEAVTSRGLANEVEVTGTGCLGLCNRGPLVLDSSDGALYGGLSGDEGLKLVESGDTGALAPKRVDSEMPFFRQQERIVLENSGRVDPERIEDYIATGGYTSLAKAVTDMTPKEVLSEIKNSGLRGRGGAGYPTGLKWELVAKNPATTKYVICNADEGDPGAFMDRSVLEGDPHRVIEGMAIAGYAVGSTQGYIYVRGEYTLAIQRLQKALQQVERNGILGHRVLQSGFGFRIDIRIGAGAFVCGEETALIASIEGGRGEPKPRPPYPPEKGLFGQPTLINNVETYANVAPILRNGAAWFSSIGTAQSKGTKVFAMAGKINHTGLVEVPMGTPLRKIVFEIGGGVAEGKKFKAVQTGGPSGGCIPESLLDTPVDYESLSRIGSIMGSGGLIVMDESTNMVDVARYFMEFCRDESCGKCVPCRAGTVQMHEILARMSRGEATDQDLELLKELAQLLKETSLCGLGQTAPNPVLSALRYFPEEFAERLRAAKESSAS